MTNRIDAHIHFWQYDKGNQAWISREMRALRENFLPEQIQTSLKRNGVEGCVAVESSASELDTHFLIELARTHPVVKGVVGWVDFFSDKVEERLDYFSQYPEIRGWRYGLEEKPPMFSTNADFRRGLRSIATRKQSFDLLLTPRQLPEAVECVADFPELNFVLDHAGKPDIRNRDLDNWKAAIRSLSVLPNVYCKLSGFLTLAEWKQWSASTFFPYLDVLFESFGPDRLLFGSDWPLINLSGIYVQWISLLEKYLENASEEEKSSIFGDNARKIYRLDHGDGSK